MRTLRIFFLTLRGQGGQEEGDMRVYNMWRRATGASHLSQAAAADLTQGPSSRRQHVIRRRTCCIQSRDLHFCTTSDCHCRVTHLNIEQHIDQ